MMMAMKKMGAPASLTCASWPGKISIRTCGDCGRSVADLLVVGGACHVLEDSDEAEREGGEALELVIVVKLRQCHETRELEISVMKDLQHTLSPKLKRNANVSLGRTHAVESLHQHSHEQESDVQKQQNDGKENESVSASQSPLQLSNIGANLLHLCKRRC
mmetsp:Transcript_49023/g.153929  ORF Transcript_49023/g.153929 Transcript_49023/m.153929 type:complete len:161 (-) Transcript_49023:221-703(-)